MTYKITNGLIDRPTSGKKKRRRKKNKCNFSQTPLIRCIAIQVDAYSHKLARSPELY